MSKEIGRIIYTETDSGLRIDITGDKLKEMVSCCCLPCVPVQSSEGACSPPKQEKKE